MTKLSHSPLTIVYRHQPSVMLWFAAMSGLILGGNFACFMPTAAMLVLALFRCDRIHRGLGGDEVVLDLAGRRLRYEERVADFVMRTIQDDFDRVESILVDDASIQKP